MTKPSSRARYRNYPTLQLLCSLIIIQIISRTVGSNYINKSSASVPVYTLIGPAIIRPDGNYTAVLTVESFNNNLNSSDQSTAPYKMNKTVTISLRNERNIISSTHAILIPNTSQLVILPVGKVSDRKYNLTVSVPGEKEQSVSVPVARSDYMFFVDMPKLNYRVGAIGEKVEFRILALNENLIPPNSTEYVNVTITDSRKNIIQRWVNAELKNGLFTGSMYFAKSPNLGKWELEVKKRREIEPEPLTENNPFGPRAKRPKKNAFNQVMITHEFYVRNLLIPRFTVDVSLPPFVSYDNPILKVAVRVSASRTPLITENEQFNGRDLQGQLEVKVTSGEGFKKKPKHQPLIQNFTLTDELGDEKATFEFDLLNGFNILDKGKNTFGTFKVIAKYTNDKFGDEVTASKTVELFRFPFDIEEISDPQKKWERKPGLPFQMTFKVIRRDQQETNSTDNNQQIPFPKELSIAHGFACDGHKPEGYINSTVPTDGVITLTFPPVENPLQSAQEVEVILGDNRKRFGLPPQSKSVKGFYLKVDTMKPSQDIEPGKNATFVLTSTHPITTFNYVIMGYGMRILDQGRVDNDKPQTKTQLVVTIPNVRFDATLLISSIFPGDVVVSDSYKILMPIDIEEDSGYSGPAPNKLFDILNSLYLKINTLPNSNVSFSTVYNAHSLEPKSDRDNVNELTGKRVQDAVRDFDKNLSPCCSAQSSGKYLHDPSFVIVTNGVKDRTKIKGRNKSRRNKKKKRPKRPVSPVSHDVSEFPKVQWAHVVSDVNGIAKSYVIHNKQFTASRISAFSVHPKYGLRKAIQLPVLNITDKISADLSLPRTIRFGEEIEAPIWIMNNDNEEHRVPWSIHFFYADYFHFWSNYSGGLNGTFTGEPVMLRPGEKRKVYFRMKPKDFPNMPWSSASVNESRIRFPPRHSKLQVMYHIPTNVTEGPHRQNITRHLNMKVPAIKVQELQYSLIDFRSTNGTLETIIPLKDKYENPRIPGKDFVEFSMVNHVSDMMTPPSAMWTAEDIGMQLLSILFKAEDSVQFQSPFQKLKLKLNGTALWSNLLSRFYQELLPYRVGHFGYTTSASLSRNSRLLGTSEFGTFSFLEFNSEEQGSVWLTAFLTRVLLRVKRHTTVDDLVTEYALDALRKYQYPTGEFTEDARGGLLISSKRKDPVAITAFCTLAFIEALNLSDTAENRKTTKKALNWIADQEKKIVDDYSMSLATYALVQGKHKKADDFFANLTQNFTFHSTLQLRNVSSLPESLETISYTLLSYLLQNRTESETMPIAQAILGNLHKVPYGQAHASLEALRNFQNSAYRKPPGKDDDDEFYHSLAYTTADPSSILNLTLNGTGIKFAKLETTYFINRTETNNSGSFFKLNVTATEMRNGNLLEVIPCVTYSGPGSSRANLVSLNIEAPSGYTWDPFISAKTELHGHFVDPEDNIKDDALFRVRVKSSDQNGILRILFERLKRGTSCVPLGAAKEINVVNRARAYVKLSSLLDSTQNLCTSYDIINNNIDNN